MSLPLNVLFLCTGNSARSIIAESICNTACPDRLRGHSAGSAPTGAVHPEALRLLQARGHDVAPLRSKSWERFAAEDAPAMAIVITVCDHAGQETCPVWPGHPVTAHWGLPDPAAATGSDAAIRSAFARTHEALARRIGALAALPLERLGAAALRERLRAIGDAPDRDAV